MNTKKIQLSVLAIFLAAALVSSVATFGIDNVQAGGDRDHKKDKDKHDDKRMKHDDKKEEKYNKKGNNNYASQDIEQAQASNQNSQCVAAGGSSEQPIRNGETPTELDALIDNGNNGLELSGIFASCNN